MAKKQQRTLYGDVFGDLQKVDGKEKGNRNELVVAKLLAAWTGVEFNRTPGSGGLRWIEASRISGDVVAPINFNFPFSVETKFYADIGIVGKLIITSITFRFWQQACFDADRSHREPMMFLRRNGMPEKEYVIFVEEWIGDILEKHFGLECCTWVDPMMAIDPEIPWITGFYASEFLTIDYYKFINYYERAKRNRTS